MEILEILQKKLPYNMELSKLGTSEYSSCNIALFPMQIADIVRKIESSANHYE